MRLEQLKYVVTIAEYQSINKASNSLFITPQALNRSIAALEKEMGVTIFERFTTGVQLTKEGTQVVEMAKRMLNDYKTVMNSLHHQPVSNHETRKIYLYAHSTYIDSYFNEIVIQFNKKYNDVQVIINSYNFLTQQLIRDNLQNPEKNNWMFLSNFAKNEKFRVPFLEEIMQDTIMLPTVLDGKCIACVSRDNLLAKQKEVSLKILSQYPLVHFSSGTEMAQAESCFYGYKTKSAHTTSNLISWIHAIADNVGVGVILDTVYRERAKTRDLFEKVKVLSIKEDTSYQSYFWLPPNYSPDVANFIDFSTSELKRLI